MAKKNTHSVEALAAFDELVDELLVRPEVTRGRWFGSPGAMVDGRIFVCLYQDTIVAKLGQEEVDARIGAGDGAHFDPSGKGHGMKDWLETTAERDAWLELAESAYDFVVTLDDDA